MTNILNLLRLLIASIPKNITHHSETKPDKPAIKETKIIVPETMIGDIVCSELCPAAKSSPTITPTPNMKRGIISSVAGNTPNNNSSQLPNVSL